MLAMSGCFPIMRSISRSNYACWRASGTTPCVIGHVSTLVASCPRRQSRRAGQQAEACFENAPVRPSLLLFSCPVAIAYVRRPCSLYEPCHDCCSHSSAPTAAQGSWPRPQVVTGSESGGGSYYCVPSRGRRRSPVSRQSPTPQSFPCKRFAVRVCVHPLIFIGNSAEICSTCCPHGYGLFIAPTLICSRLSSHAVCKLSFAITEPFIHLLVYLFTILSYFYDVSVFCI